MIVIRTKFDLDCLKQKRALPGWYLKHLEEFFMLLYTSSGEGILLESFSLDGHAEIVVLERGDDLRVQGLPMLPGQPTLFDLDPEYVGKMRLGAEAIYRITLMPDNERMVFVFSEVDQFDLEIEAWFQDQLAWSTMFVEDDVDAVTLPESQND